MIGIAGKESQEDCMAKVELKTEGGLEVRVNSKVVEIFGSLIEKAAIEAAEGMGIENAIIEVNDFGSLDFVIKARVKTAITRAWRG